MNVSHLSSRPPGVEDPAEIKTRVYRSIVEVDPRLWDSLCEPHGLACTHRFLKALEESGVENAQYWYLLMYRDEVPIGAAVLSSFIVSLDLLNPGLQGIARFVRRLIPRFLKVKVLFCGLPISIGKHTVCSNNDHTYAAVIERVADEMDKIARQCGTGLLCAKEFAASDMQHIERFRTCGYFRASSIPRVSLMVEWPDYRSYLSSLRAGYRRQTLANLRKLNLESACIGHVRDASAGSNLPRFTLLPPTPELAILFSALYQSVMQRAEQKLEVLNEDYFKRMFVELSGDLELIALKHGDRIIAAALVAEVRGTLHFLFAGLDYSCRDEFDAYFNLLHAIVALAIERKCSRIDMGQTSYRPKLRIGCEPEEMYLYLKAGKPIAHAVLRALRPVLFPRTRLPRLRVFRQP